MRAAMGRPTGRRPADRLRSRRAPLSRAPGHVVTVPRLIPTRCPQACPPGAAQVDPAGMHGHPTQPDGAWPASGPPRQPALPPSPLAAHAPPPPPPPPPSSSSSPLPHLPGVPHVHALGPGGRCRHQAPLASGGRQEGLQGGEQLARGQAGGHGDDVVLPGGACGAADGLQDERLVLVG